jgi:hypothetical protein
MSPEELRAWMESDNRQWLVDPRLGPVQGKSAVKRYWREQLQTSTDHTFDIVRARTGGLLRRRVIAWRRRGGVVDGRTWGAALA